MRTIPRRNSAIRLNIVTPELTITGAFCAWELVGVVSLSSGDGITVDLLVDLLDGSSGRGLHSFLAFRSRRVTEVNTGWHAKGDLRTSDGRRHASLLSLDLTRAAESLVILRVEMTYDTLDDRCWREIREAVIRRNEPYSPVRGTMRDAIARV